MKTAISIPDKLFYSVENTSKELGIPRSQLFAIAMKEYIQKHEKVNITAKLNSVYKNEINLKNKKLNQNSLNTLRNSLKNDSW